jgi:hypothetical protein
VNPALVPCSSTIGIDGSRPPGKISVTMNFTNRANWNDSGMPRSAISLGCSPVMVCRSITPSSGSASYAIAK